MTGGSFCVKLPVNNMLTNSERSFYVPSDKQILNECKLVEKVGICKRTQPTCLVGKTHSCESEILKLKVKEIQSKTCQILAFQIIELAYIPFISKQSIYVSPRIRN